VFLMSPERVKYRARITVSGPGSCSCSFHGNVLRMMLDAATESSPSAPSTAALAWRSSSYCANGACVEVALDGDRVGIRDNKDLGSGELWLTPVQFRAFIAAVRDDFFA